MGFLYTRQFRNLTIETANIQAKFTFSAGKYSYPILLNKKKKMLSIEHNSDGPDFK